MAKEKRKVGRPSTLTPEHIEGARWYLKGGWKERSNQIPSVAGLAVFLGITRQMAYQWKNHNTEFADILDAIQTAQEMVLLDGGLSGDMNASIVKLTLGKHGYSDKQETALSGSIETVRVSDLTDEELAEELAKYGIKPG